MEACGLPASRSLLRSLLLRLAELELPKPKGRGAVSLVRRLCYLHHEDLDTSSYFRLGFSTPDQAKKYPSGGTLAQCIVMASPELWPRWGRALGRWAKRSKEDASVPFRALLDVSGIRKTPEAAVFGEEHRRHQQKVLQALSQTGLLERMITKQVLTEAEVSRVRQIQLFVLQG